MPTGTNITILAKARTRPVIVAEVQRLLQALEGARLRGQTSFIITTELSEREVIFPVMRQIAENVTVTDIVACTLPTGTDGVRRDAFLVTLRHT